MIVFLPRNVRIDLDDIPNDFEAIVRKTFHDYTSGTAVAYRYHDKLAFIDRCSEIFHRSANCHEAVKTLIVDRTEFELDEYGELPDKDDFWSMEFMEDCYEQGKKDAQLYSKYYSESECMQRNDKHLNDKIMKLMERIIKVVINYEDSEV